LDGLRSLLSELLGELMCIHGVLERLFAEVVSAEMISFTMSDCSGGVGMGRKIMELYDSIV
jgi:hypothetical protein